MYAGRQRVFKKIFKIEKYLAREKKKLNLHLEKWEKLLTGDIRVCPGH